MWLMMPWKLPVGIVVQNDGDDRRLVEQAVHAEHRSSRQQAEFEAEEIGNPLFTLEALEEEFVFPEAGVDANVPAGLSQCHLDCKIARTCTPV